MAMTTPLDSDKKIEMCYGSLVTIGDGPMQVSRCMACGYEMPTATVHVKVEKDSTRGNLRNILQEIRDNLLQAKGTLALLAHTGCLPLRYQAEVENRVSRLYSAENGLKDIASCLGLVENAPATPRQSTDALEQLAALVNPISSAVTTEVFDLEADETRKALVPTLTEDNDPTIPMRAVKPGFYEEETVLVKAVTLGTKDKA